MDVPRSGSSSSAGTLPHWQAIALLSIIAALVSQWIYAGSIPGDLSKTSIKNVLVLTAHPDDEVMFFAPAILSLVAAGAQVYGLCMSAGNADGLGDVRKSELVQAYQSLGVPSTQVTLIDDPLLADGMDVAWNPAYIATKTAAVVYDHQIDTILTFDSSGVSSHPNHVALHRAAWGYLGRSLGRERQNRIAEGKMDASASAGPLAPSVYALHTPPLLSKFLSLPMALYSHAHAQRHLSIAPPTAPSRPGWPDRMHFLSSPGQYLRTLQAMQAHASQLVWFRYLYVVFSRLMYGSQLDRIEVML
ncbi:N-acetylglucosaminyl-phosphatidylinositol de-N-acetylase [Tilletia horrida]|nr:N-acetylglucosaminyl-phosphatidylinositol de-N-acetylase [Tilletia horrida]